MRAGDVTHSLLAGKTRQEALAAHFPFRVVLVDADRSFGAPVLEAEYDTVPQGDLVFRECLEIFFVYNCLQTIKQELQRDRFNIVTPPTESGGIPDVGKCLVVPPYDGIAVQVVWLLFELLTAFLPFHKNKTDGSKIPEGLILDNFAELADGMPPEIARDE